MALCSPSIVGPISPCVNSIRVQNQLVGSTVTVLRNGSNVGGGPATWTDQTFNLDAGVTLHPNDKITAKQTYGGAESGPTPNAVIVQNNPLAPLNAVTFASPVLNCSNALLISGAVPGAAITLTDMHGAVRGTGVASLDGSVGIGIAPQLGHGEILQAMQTACGLTQAGPTLSPSPNDPPNRLPPPIVENPLYACAGSVTVSNVVPGAVVTLTPTAGSTESGAFVVSAEYFRVPPLNPLETVTASQAFPHCQPEVRPAASALVKVGRAQPPRAPVVIGPLCPGAVSVRLTKLTVGDNVEISQNGTSIGQAGVSKTTDDFYVSTSLVANAAITAVQRNQCPHPQTSGVSNAVTVNSVAATVTPPAIAKPIYECASVIRVTDIHPGSMVEIESVKFGLIGFKTVYATASDIPVAPQLVAGDTITAIQIGCGHTSGPSPPATVQTFADLQPPVVLPITNCAHSVRVSQVTPGAIVDVFVQVGSTLFWLASATATLTTVDVPLGGGITLTVGEVLCARQRLCSQVAGPGKPQTVTQGVCSYTTQHFDNYRTGWNSYETTLTQDSLATGFGVLATLKVDGQVFAQPLYLRGVTIGGVSRNLLVVATATDWIYAFDADTFAEVWPARQLVQSGGRPIPSADAYKEGPGEPGYAPDIQPTVGIIGTPVIDQENLILYVVATSQSPLVGSSRNTVTNLHAIDLTTGSDRAGSPVAISAQFPPNSDGTPFGDGTVAGGLLQFDPSRQMQRPGLLLTRGLLFLGFGSYGDFFPWHGWLLVYRAATLNQVGYFNTTPDQVTPTPPDAGNNGGAIWQGGMGIAADNASLYFSTGNGPFNASVANGRNYGDSVLRFSLDMSIGDDRVLPVGDYFSPWNQYTLCGNDGDVGSGGVLLVPQAVGGQNLLLQCGKSSQVFVLDRANLGKYNGTPPNLPPPGSGTNKVVDDKYILDGNGVWGGPGYYVDSNNNPVVFYAGTSGHLNRLTFGAQQQIVQSAQTTQTFQSGNSNGFTVNVSSNGSASRTGIVWLVDRNNLPTDPNVRLFAYDADTLKTQLAEIPAGSWTTKGTFTDPTVINGRVYVGSDGQITVLGLDPALGPA
jgi:hypothetical protein